MGLTVSGLGFHRCPRHGCHLEVADTRYACPKDWSELSPETKRKIMATRHMHVLNPGRRLAFRMADNDWGQ